MQITRFRDNLPHTMTDSSELCSITWRELQDAWLEAFNAVAYSAGWPQVASEPIISPDALDRRHVSPHLASSQFAQPLDPDQLLLCRTTASPGAESPWLMVCASIPTLAMAEPVSQVVPQALPESTVAVGVSGISETSVTDLRGERSLRRSVASTSLPRMTPQALARMQQQQARQIRARRAAQTRRAAAASAGVRPGQPTGDATRRREANRESMFLSILSGVTSWLKWACLTGLPRHWQPIASA